MIKQSFKHLNSLLLPNHLFKASNNKKTNYNRIWIRDNLYISLAFETIKDSKTIINLYSSLFNLFLKYEYKIDNVIKEKPIEDYKFLHPLYNEDLTEIKENWGWKQNDTIGHFLFKIGTLNSIYHIIQNNDHKRILKKLIKYLESIKYYEDDDSGMWEENKEIHSSSVGACVAGLKAISNISPVPPELILRGENTLLELLPKESTTKNTDLSLLSLLYPFNIVNNENYINILNNIENNLLRNKGVIRYINDQYYIENNTEASWCFGLPWMAICYYKIGNIKKYKYYIKKTINSLNDNLEIPELYIKDKKENGNTPLGWGQSLLINALNI